MFEIEETTTEKGSQFYLYDPFRDEQWDEDKVCLMPSSEKYKEHILLLPWDETKRQWDRTKGCWTLNMESLLMIVSHLSTEGTVVVNDDALEEFEEVTGIRTQLKPEDYNDGPKDTKKILPTEDSAGLTLSDIT